MIELMARFCYLRSRTSTTIHKCPSPYYSCWKVGQSGAGKEEKRFTGGVSIMGFFIYIYITGSSTVIHNLMHCVTTKDPSFLHLVKRACPKEIEGLERRTKSYSCRHKGSFLLQFYTVEFPAGDLISVIRAIKEVKSHHS